MNIRDISITHALVLSTAALLINQQIYSLNLSRIAISSISAIGGSIGGGALYGHIILPWITNKQIEEEKKHVAENHAKEQEKWRAYYRAINTKYNAASTPMDTSHTLCEYKKQLTADLSGLEKAISFDWDDQAEKQALINLAQYLKEHEIKVTKLIGFKIGQETHDQFKDELAALVSNSSFDANKMSKLIYEKYGDTAYKYSSYKKALCETIMQCKQLGAPQETVQALENLNKVTNFLFATALDQERISREQAEKQEKLLNAELADKTAIKDFYKDAQRHVQEASNTVRRLSEEIDNQSHAQKKAFDSCIAMIQNIFSTWSLHSEQQTERVVHEIRHDGQTTRETITTTVNAKNSALERKLNDVERKANEAKEKAAEAKATAQAALPPLPPATNPNYIPEPSAPPYEPNK